MVTTPFGQMVPLSKKLKYKLSNRYHTPALHCDNEFALTTQLEMLHFLPKSVYHPFKPPPPNCSQKPHISSLKASLRTHMRSDHPAPYFTFEGAVFY